MLLFSVALCSPISYRHVEQPGPFTITKSTDPSVWTFLSFSVQASSFLSMQVRRNLLQGCLNPGVAIFRGRPADSAGLSSSGSLNPDAVFLKRALPAGAFGTALLEVALALPGDYVVAVWGENGGCLLGAAVVAAFELQEMSDVLNCSAIPLGFSKLKCAQFVSAIIEQTFVSKRGLPVPVVPVTVASALEQPLMLPNNGIAYPPQWRFITFSGSAGSVVTLRVVRMDACVDPAVSLFQGVPASTDGLSAFGSSRSDATWLSFGDDELAPAISGGPLRDVQLSVVLPVTGSYTLAVFAYRSSCSSSTGSAKLSEFVVAAAQACSMNLDVDSVKQYDQALPALSNVVTQPGFASLDATNGQDSSAQWFGVRFVIESPAVDCRVRVPSALSPLLADGCTASGVSASVTLAAYGLVSGNYSVTLHVFDPEADSGTVIVSAFGREMSFVPSIGNPSISLPLTSFVASTATPARFSVRSASVARHVRLAGLHLDRLDTMPPVMLCGGPLQLVADAACLAEIPQWNPVVQDDCGLENYLVNGELETVTVTDASGVQSFPNIGGWLSSPLAVARETAQTPLNPIGGPAGNSAVLSNASALSLSVFVPSDVPTFLLQFDALAGGSERMLSVVVRRSGDGIVLLNQQNLSYSPVVWTEFSLVVNNAAGATVVVEIGASGSVAVQGWINRVKVVPAPSIVNQTLFVGQLVLAGNYSVTFYQEDIHGLSSTCELEIRASDSSAPLLVQQCPPSGAVTILADPGSCSAVAQWVDPVVSDNCRFKLEYTTSDLGVVFNGGRFPAGTTTVTASVRDAVGRVSLCVFNVTVVDLQTPSVKIPPLPFMSLPCGAGYESVWKRLAAHACIADNCPSSTVLQPVYLREPSCGPPVSASSLFTLLDVNDPMAPAQLVGSSSFALHDGTCWSQPELQLDVEVVPPRCTGDSDGFARVRDVKLAGRSVDSLADYEFVWTDGTNSSLSNTPLLANVPPGVFRVRASLHPRKRAGPLGPVTPSQGLCDNPGKIPYSAEGVACVRIPVRDPLKVLLPSVVNCRNRAEAIVSGGRPPYQYQWSDGSLLHESNPVIVGATTLSVVVTDANGCTATAPSPVAFSPGLAVSVVTVGGNVHTATVTGGQPSFQYVWSPGGGSSGPTLTGSGAYIVSVTDGRGCVVRASTNPAVLQVPIELDTSQLDSVATAGGALVPLSVQLADTKCTAEGKLLLRAQAVGGVPPYAFSWENGAFVAGDTTFKATPGLSYTVQVKDAQSTTVRATFNAGLLPGLEVSTVGCLFNFGAISLRVLGQAVAPLRFVWSNGVITQTPLISYLPVTQDQYSVTLTDSRGCSAAIQSIYTLSSCSPLGGCFQCGVEGSLNYCCTSSGLNFVGCSVNNNERFCTSSIVCSNATACSSDDDCQSNWRCMAHSCCGGNICSPVELSCDVGKREQRLTHCSNKTSICN